MNKRTSRPLKSEAKALLLLICASAFLSVLATFDLSEQHRAWRSAETWNDVQREVASASDAESIKPLILSSLVINTFIVAFSFIALLLLGVYIATDSKAGIIAVKVLVLIILTLGISLLLLLIVYKIKLGTRLILKGPIYDYDLGFKPPLLLALFGYPALIVGYLVNRSLGGGRDAGAGKKS
jgi:uncharacterized membrane protein